VPQLATHPEGWFACVDLEANGRLSLPQVQQVLLTQFPVDHQLLDATLPALWGRWDRDGTGLSKREFVERGGLLDFVRQHLIKE